MKIAWLITFLLLMLAATACEVPAGAQSAPEGANPMGTPGANISKRDTALTPQSASDRDLPPEIAALQPAADSNACRRPRLSVDLFLTDALRKDGAFDPSTVTLMLDGKDVTAAATIRVNLTYPASRATITYTPPADLPLGAHQAALTFATSAGRRTHTWNFVAAAIPCDQDN